jgi:hypothetical protein
MAKLLTGTRIYGTANVDSVLVVGNVTSNNSTSNTTGSLIVTGGVGISGNIYVGGTNAGVNGVYTDVLRYAANGLPWVMNSGSGGGGGGTGTGNANTYGWTANTVIIANTAGYLSNTSNLQFFTAAASPTGFNTLKANGNIVVGNNATTNTATMLYNPTVNSIDIYFS